MTSLLIFILLFFFLTSATAVPSCSDIISGITFPNISVYLSPAFGGTVIGFDTPTCGAVVAPCQTVTQGLLRMREQSQSLVNATFSNFGSPNLTVAIIFLPGVFNSSLDVNLTLPTTSALQLPFPYRLQTLYFCAQSSSDQSTISLSGKNFTRALSLPLSDTQYIIDGLRFSGGTFLDVVPDSLSPGVLVFQNGSSNLSDISALPPTVQNCIFDNHKVIFTGAFAAIAAAASNSSSLRGASSVIWIGFSHSPSFSNCLFQENSLSVFRVTDAAALKLDSSIFQNNTFGVYNDVTFPLPLGTPYVPALIWISTTSNRTEISNTTFQFHHYGSFFKSSYIPSLITIAGASMALLSNNYFYQNQGDLGVTLSSLESANAVIVDTLYTQLQSQFVEYDTSPLRGFGGVFFATDQSSQTYTRCEFYSNAAAVIGGVGAAFGDARITLSNSDFDQNSASGIQSPSEAVIEGQTLRATSAGVIFATDLSQLFVDQCRFFRSIVWGYGGLFMTTLEARLQISNSVMENNEALGSGSVLYSRCTSQDLSSPTITISSSSVDLSQSQSLDLGGDLSILVENVTFTGNKYPIIQVNEAGPTVIFSNSTFTGNQGIAELDADSNVTFTGSFFTDNAPSLGAATFLLGKNFPGTLALIHSEFNETNYLTEYLISSPSDVVTSRASVEIDACIFRYYPVGIIQLPSERIHIRGTLFLDSIRPQYQTIKGKSPMFNVQNGTVVSENCTFLRTLCQLAVVGSGGTFILNSSFVAKSDVTSLNAQMLLSVAYGGKLILENSNFVDNKGGWGGVVATGINNPLLLDTQTILSSFTCRSTVFETNQAEAVLGLAFLSSGKIENCSFLNNSVYRGAVSIYGGIPVSISASTFAGNVASDRGAAVFLSGATGDQFSQFVAPYLLSDGTYLGGLLPAVSFTNTSFVANRALIAGGAIYVNSDWSVCSESSMLSKDYENALWLQGCIFTDNEASFAPDTYWGNAAFDLTTFQCDLQGSKFPRGLCTDCSFSSLNSSQGGPPYQFLSLSDVPPTLEPGSTFDVLLLLVDIFGNAVPYRSVVELNADPPTSLFLTTTSGNIQPTDSSGIVRFPGISCTGDPNLVVTYTWNVTQILSSSGESILVWRVSPFSQEVVIVSCPVGSGYIDDVRGRRCEMCGSQTYNRKGDSICLPCPAGAICPGGDQLVTKAGFWWLPTTSLAPEFYPCSVGACCPNGFCPLMDSMSDTDNASAVVCGLHRSGRLCSVCAPGFSEWSGQCVPCERPVAVTPSSALTFLIGFYVIYTGFQDPTDDPTIPRGLFFFQVAGLIINNQNLALQWLTVFLMDIDLFSGYLEKATSGAPTCVADFTPSQKLTFGLVAPLILLSVAIVIYAVYGCVYLIVKRIKGQMSEKWSKPGDVFVSGILKVLLYFYLPFIRACLSFLICDSIGNINVLAAAPSLDCIDSSRTPLVFLALLCGLLVIPLYLVRVLTNLQHGGFLGKRENVLRYGSFYFFYRSNKTWFGFVVLFTTTLLVTITVCLLKFYLWRILLQTLLLMILLLLFAFYQPYKKTEYNQQELGWVFGLIALGSIETASFDGKSGPPDDFTFNYMIVLQLMIIILSGGRLGLAILKDGIATIRQWRQKRRR